MLNSFKIELSNNTYDVIVEKKKIKNMYLRVIDNHTLKITCHLNVPKNQIIHFIERKEEWILETIKARSNSKLFTNGPCLYLFGKKYFLDIHISNSRCVVLDHDIMHLYIKENNNEEIMQVFYAFAKKELMNYINNKKYTFENYLKDYGEYHPIINIRKMSSKWGVCYPELNKITINLLLVHFDYHCIDYVLWHEYCHFIVPNHSKRFYHLMEYHMPDYKLYKEMLR